MNAWDDDVEGILSDLDLRTFRGTWDYGRLPKNIELGQGCFIESPRLVAMFRSQQQPGLVLKDGVRLYLGGWGGQLSIGPDGVVEIGERSVLAGVQMMCKERITIGADVSISYNAVIADSDFHPRDPLLRRADAISGSPYGEFTGFSPVPSAPVVIKDGAVIGMNVLILKGVTIGEGARVWPGSVVTRDVPDGTVIMGNPAHPVEPS